MGAIDILHTVLDAGYDGNDEEGQDEKKSVERALKILYNAPSRWLYRTIKKLAAGMSEDQQVFFSEDGKTALIVVEKGENTMFVKLTEDEYATAAAKLFWAKAGREEFGTQQ